jgi:hypothetical protein
MTANALHILNGNQNKPARRLYDGGFFQTTAVRSVKGKEKIVEGTLIQKSWVESFRVVGFQDYDLDCCREECEPLGEKCRGALKGVNIPLSHPGIL